MYIYIYVVSLIFLFQKLDQSNTIDILNRTDGLSRSAEKMNRVRKREREREGGRKRAWRIRMYVHVQSNQMFLSFFSYSMKQVKKKRKKKTTFVNGEPIRPTSTTLLLMEHSRRPMSRKKWKWHFLFATIVHFSSSSSWWVRYMGNGTLMHCFNKNRRTSKERTRILGTHLFHLSNEQNTVRGR